MSEKEMRVVYAEKICELAAQDSSIVALEADLMKASGMALFQKSFPERMFDMGVAEANMIGAAAGLAASGKIPFVHTFACFVTRRAYDQVFLSVGYAKQNVKLVGSDPGVSAAFNGGTHMPFEDVGVMRNIPEMVIFEPCDPVSLAALTEANYAYRGASYMRLFRKPAARIYADGESFTLGKGKILQDGNDVALFASGVIMVKEALKAAELLRDDNINAAVIDMHTIKPLDEDLVVHYAKKCKAVITCENHQIFNGLGSAVAECLGEKYPTRIIRVGINDHFGEVGTQAYLQECFGLNADTIVKRAKALLI